MQQFALFVLGVLLTAMAYWSGWKDEKKWLLQSVEKSLFYHDPVCIAPLSSGGFYSASLETRRLSSQCDIAVYTSVFYDQPKLAGQLSSRIYIRKQFRHAPTPRFSSCYFVFTNRKTGQELLSQQQQNPEKTSLWNIIIVDEPLHFEDWNNKNSKIPKLLPGLFFPTTKFSLFVDWKLQQNVPPSFVIEKALVAHNASMSLWKHKRTARGIRAKNWMKKESDIIAGKKGKVKDLSLLQNQTDRYLKSKVPISRYAEGSLIYRETAANLTRTVDCEWFKEFALPYNSERDQISLAYVLGKVFGEGEIPGFKLLKQCDKYLCIQSNWQHTTNKPIEPPQDLLFKK